MSVHGFLERTARSGCWTVAAPGTIDASGRGIPRHKLHIFGSRHIEKFVMGQVLAFFLCQTTIFHAPSASFVGPAHGISWVGTLYGLHEHTICTGWSAEKQDTLCCNTLFLVLAHDIWGAAAL